MEAIKQTIAQNTGIGVRSLSASQKDVTIYLYTLFTIFHARHVFTVISLNENMLTSILV